jgi:hypothetical protein
MITLSRKHNIIIMVSRLRCHKTMLYNHVFMLTFHYTIIKGSVMLSWQRYVIMKTFPAIMITISYCIFMITISWYQEKRYHFLMTKLLCYYLDNGIMVSWQRWLVIMIKLSCYHGNAIMLAWQRHIIMTALSCYHDNVSMLVTTLSCYHDKIIMLPLQRSMLPW